MKIKNLIRSNIQNLKPYTSARDVYNKGVLLDANENSFGSVFADLKELQLNRYPDPHQKELRKIISEYLNIPAENFFFGVGSDEIIDLLIRIFCEPGKDNIIIPEPTYGMYKVSADINNVQTNQVLLNDDFQLDLDEIKDNLTGNTKMIFICSPNNPTGNLLRYDDIIELIKSENIIVVVDEAYIDFTNEGSVIYEVLNHPNLVVLRTFSKAWGLAGIRLGYCAASIEIINYLFKVKAPYNISALTRSVLQKAMLNKDKKDFYVSSILKEKERLKKLLESLSGVKKVFQSDANFLLFQCDNPKEVQKNLADKGIIIRDRSSQPKLEGCLRVSVGTEEENDFFWEGIKRILG